MASTATLTKPTTLNSKKPVRLSNGHHRSAPKPPDVVWRLSVEHYHQMIETGILTDDDPVELLEGWLIEKMPKGPHHSSAIYSLRQLFEKQLIGEWYIDSQDAITLVNSEPEPDLFIAQGSAKQFRHRHPYAEDLLIVVEVADATLSRDRNLKKRIYAQAGIPAYWLVNLVEQQIEVYSEPTPNAKNPTYLQRKDYGLSEKVPLQILDQHLGEVVVAEVIASE